MTTLANTIANTSVALLAGGLATRLRPITTAIPKAMVEVAGRPFIGHQLELLHKSGIRHAVLCLGHLGEQVREYVGDGAEWGMRVDYSFDGDRLLGTGGALRRALPQLSEVFWVMYGDSYLEVDYQSILSSFDHYATWGLMTVLRNDNLWDKSNVVFQEGQLRVYDKKQTRPDMNYIDYGLGILRRSALERIPPNTVADLEDLYRDLVAEGLMVGYEVTRRFYEIGSHEGLEELREQLSQPAA